MPHLFSYRDAELYSHHTLDVSPQQTNHSMHAHELMEIFFFISGKGSYLVEGTSYPLQPNDILILREAETHTLTISPDEPYERIAIHFSPALLNHPSEETAEYFQRLLFSLRRANQGRGEHADPQMVAAQAELEALQTEHAWLKEMTQWQP